MNKIYEPVLLLFIDMNKYAKILTIRLSSLFNGNAMI